MQRYRKFWILVSLSTNFHKLSSFSIVLIKKKVILWFQKAELFAARIIQVKNFKLNLIIMTTLSKGSKGDEVRFLQRLLNWHGAALKIDSDFGSNTETAVKEFQTKNELLADGIVTDKIWTALWKPWLLSVTLLKKSDNEDIRMIQNGLNHFGYQLVTDGLYGGKTTNALRHYKALRQNDPDSDYSKYIENLRNDTTLLNKNPSKKETLLYIANIMINTGYEFAYVVGMLANSFHEGNVGQFESSNYINNIGQKPAYLKEMDENYGYKDYSGKTIMNVSLSDVEKLINRLAADKWVGKFGLGSIQWTEIRCQRLVEHYRAVAGNNDTITELQAIQAEGNFILEELKDVKLGYIAIYPDWKDDNAKKTNSSKAAEKAAQELCKKYEIPIDKDKKAKERGDTAIKIYEIMNSPKRKIIDTDDNNNIFIKGKENKIKVWIENIIKKIDKSR